jgi:hypothetical protein
MSGQGRLNSRENMSNTEFSWAQSVTSVLWKWILGPGWDFMDSSQFWAVAWRERSAIRTEQPRE